MARGHAAGSPSSSFEARFGRARRWALVLAVPVALLSGQATAHAADDDPWIGHDKMLHATISAGLGAGFYALSVPFVSRRPVRAAVGFLAAFSVGAVKELVDIRSGDPSGRDLAWDAIGALSGVGVAALIDFAWCRLRHRKSDDGRHLSVRQEAPAW